jgi:acetyltransferase-like isoleucine patch superfamily enzyme
MVGISNMTHISISGNNLKIGDYVFIGHFNYIDAFNAEVIIGDHCQITNYVSILTHSSHNEVRFSEKGHLDPKANKTIYSIKSVKIGDYSYIGPHSVIMPGTVLGKGCLVSAFSYVNGEFPDYSIIRGQPARVIGSTKDLDEKILSEYPTLIDSYYL